MGGVRVAGWGGGAALVLEDCGCILTPGKNQQGSKEISCIVLG